MDDALEKRLIERWQTAAADLGIRVIAPVMLHDAAGTAFYCEAFLPDFGAKNGAVIVDARTERRVRGQLSSLGDSVYVVGAERKLGPTYNRSHIIDELLDHGWYGKPGDEPDWYLQRRG
jgi:hypothetical protein